MRFVLGLLVLTALACANKEETAYLGLPDSEARSMVISIRVGENVRFFAVQPTAGTAALSMPFELDDEAASIEVLSYADTLEGIGLSAGELLHDSAGESLPEEGRVFTTTVQGSSPEAWLEQPGRSEDVRDLLVALRDSLCVRFVAESAEVGGLAESVAFMLPFDDEVTLAGTTLLGEARPLFSLKGQRVTIADTRPSDMGALSAARAPDGEFWFGASGGRLFKGRVNLGPTNVVTIEANLVSTSSSGEPIASIATSGLAEAFELYTLSSGGALERFDGRDWALLHHFHAAIGDGGRVIRTGPGHVYAAGPENAQLAEYAEGRIRDASPPGIVEAIEGFGYAPGLGVMVVGGTQETNLLGTDNAWKPVLDRPVMRRANAIEPVDAGLLIGGYSGATTQYYPGFGFCEVELLGTQSIIRIASTADGFVLGTSARTNDQRPSITRVRRR